MGYETVYKLTKPNLTTYGGYKYEVGKEHTFPGTGPLCSSGWGHAYRSQPLAELLNPIHAEFGDYRVWEAKALVGISDHNLKVGCSSMTLVRELSRLNITIEQRLAFGIACAWSVYSSSSWTVWTQKWLDGTDRSRNAAADAARAAADAAARAAAYAAADAADAAYAAAAGAAYAAHAGAAAAAYAAAADAATRAAWTGAKFDLVQLASWAISLSDTAHIKLPEWLTKQTQ